MLSKLTSEATVREFSFLLAPHASITKLSLVYNFLLFLFCFIPNPSLFKNSCDTLHSLAVDEDDRIHSFPNERKWR